MGDVYEAAHAAMRNFDVTEPYENSRDFDDADPVAVKVRHSLVAAKNFYAAKADRLERVGLVGGRDTTEGDDVYAVGGATHQRWEKDFAQFQEALAPYAFTDEDGNSWLTEDAPESLTRPWNGLLEVGYWHGWIKD